MENVQEKLERAYERINELQNKNMELRERNSSLLKEQIQAQAIIEKQKNVVKEWIVVQDDTSTTAIKRNSILAVYQNRNMDETFVCTTNREEFPIRLPIKTVLKSIIGEESSVVGLIDGTPAKQSEVITKLDKTLQILVENSCPSEFGLEDCEYNPKSGCTLCCEDCWNQEVQS